MPIRAFENHSGQATHLSTPLRIVEYFTGVYQQLQIAELAVTQRMVEAKPLSQGGLQCRVNLCMNCCIIQMLQCVQACQPNPRCAVTPGGHKAPLDLLSYPLH